MILDIVFHEDAKTFVADFASSNRSFGGNFGEIQTVTEFVGGEPYAGDYEITPRTEEQIIPTKAKVMVEDMTVKSIPFFNVGNTSGGSTVYIGSEV